MEQTSALKPDFVLVPATFQIPPRGRLTVWIEAANTTGRGHEWAVVLWNLPGAEVRRRGYARTAEAAEEAALSWARAAVAGLAEAERALQEEPTVPEEPTMPAP